MLPATNPTENLMNNCIHQLRLFFIALQFLTRLPIPARVGFEADWLHRSSRYFPLVGVVVATAVGLVYLFAAWLWPQPVAVLLSTIVGIYLTGALHEDGFADACDAFGGGATPDRVLEIMRDSRIGAYGAIGIAMLLALKCTTLIYLPIQNGIAALLIGHPLSRLAAAALIWRFNYARAEGKAKPFAQRMSTQDFVIAAMTASIPAIVLGAAGWLSVYAILSGVLTSALTLIWIARSIVRRIGGYTGDCLGAVQQVTEVAFYLGILMCTQSRVMQ
jgi:adenosylcobinamide-GDP ribazoletransferase